MLTMPLQSKRSKCEICGQAVANTVTLGIESERDVIMQIPLCRACGPIELEVMQLCREITIGCARN